jgi:hypothetical protein
VIRTTDISNFELYEQSYQQLAQKMLSSSYRMSFTGEKVENDETITSNVKIIHRIDAKNQSQMVVYVTAQNSDKKQKSFELYFHKGNVDKSTELRQSCERYRDPTTHPLENMIDIHATLMNVS